MFFFLFKRFLQFGRKLNFEKNTCFDAGIEFAVLDNKLSGEIDFYNKAAKNALFTIPYASLGFGNSFLTNAAEIANKGVELSLQWNKKVNTKCS